MRFIIGKGDDGFVYMHVREIGLETDFLGIKKGLKNFS
jgi:hypothetical protein